MTTKKKIILTILLAVLVGVGVYGIVVVTKILINNINSINSVNKSDYEYQFYIKLIIRWITFLIFFMISIIIDVFIIKKFWGKEIAYSYQDYKQEKEKRYVKRLEKQKTKIEQRKVKIEDKIKDIKN